MSEAAATGADAPEGPWNPGLGSTIPRRLLPRVTLYRPENARLSHAEVEELAELSGIAPVELAELRPERLVVHELLVRVTADLSVPDGPNYEDLGLALRAMVRTLFERHLAPAVEAIDAAVEAERARAAARLEAELERGLLGEEAACAGGARGAATGRREARGLGLSFARRLAAWLGARSAPVRGGDGPSAQDDTAARALASVSVEDALAAVRRWRERAGDEAHPPLERACLRALARSVDGVLGRRGRLPADPAPLLRVALALAGNDVAPRVVAERVAPLFACAVAAEGYRPLPPQTRPVVMNTKGASASGKSTIRPALRALAGRLGVAWEDFALISPDYWRKYLLDYASLGADHKYGAMLTGQELEIVDRKLDARMAAKAERAEIPHLLIDRFRFDSFATAEQRPADSRLLTRFGSEIFLFFMITPPADTVERAWLRGARTGRYKAVSDLLHHNVEAYTGMPALFLSWANARGRRVRFEFLDNGVPEGTLPRTVAFGEGGRMRVLDVTPLLAVDRYRAVNVEARSPAEVLGDEDAGQAAPEATFLGRCAARLETIDFVDPASGRCYARVEGGALGWWDSRYLDALGAGGATTLAALAALGYPGRGASPADDAVVPEALDLDAARRVTVGRWGAGEIDRAVADADAAPRGQLSSSSGY